VAGVIASSASERLVETVGPIVVKEVRQGLRARVFAIFFGTLLVVCLTMALVALARVSTSNGGESGKDFFGAYLTALGGICFFVIPFVAFRSMARELEDETWVLLTLTGLGAASITRGKWVSAMSQALLFASACAPFVLFSYFLNGIDLVQIAVALMLAAAWTSLVTAVAIAISTQAHSKLGRTVAHFVVLGVLGLATAGGIGLSWVLAESGHRLVTNAGFRNFAIGAGLFSCALTWLVLEGAAAGLALASEPASRGPRKALLAVTVLGFVFGLTVFLLEDGRATDAAGGQVITALFLTFSGLLCISEPDGWPRQASGGGWLKPGALRSWYLAVGLLLASTTLWAGLMVRAKGNLFSFGLDRHSRGLFGALVYPALYLSLGVLAGRLTPLRRFGEPIATRVGFGVVLIVGVTTSVVASLAFEGRVNGKVMNALNPLMGMANFLDSGSSDLDGALVVASAAALLAVFMASITLHARDGERT